MRNIKKKIGNIDNSKEKYNKKKLLKNINNKQIKKRKNNLIKLKLKFSLKKTKKLIIKIKINKKIFSFLLFNKKLPNQLILKNINQIKKLFK